MTDSQPTPSWPDLPGRWQTPAFVLTSAMFLLWAIFISWTQWMANQVFLADFGVFDTICAGPRHGHFLRSPLAWDVEANYFAGHFRPVLLLLMPVYYILDHPMTLLTAFRLGGVGAGFVLMLLARRLTGNGLLALMLGILYFTNHFVGSVQLANHPESLGTIGLLLGFLGGHTRRWWLMAIGLLFALTVKEDYAIYVALYGVILAISRDRRDWVAAAIVIAAAVIWWFSALAIMRIAGQEAFHAAGNKPLGRFASMGDGKLDIVVYILTHPLDIAGRVLSPTLLMLYASFLFLPLMAPRTGWAPAAAGAVFLIADDPMVASLQYYYSYTAIPFLALASAEGLANLKGWLDGRPRPAQYAVPGVILLGAAINMAMPTRTDGLRRVPFEVTDHHRLANEIARRIDPKASVAAQYDLFTKVPNRPEKLPLRLPNLGRVEYIFFDIAGRPADLWGEEKHQERERLLQIIGSDIYTTEFEGDGYFLRRRVRELPPEWLDLTIPDDQLPPIIPSDGSAQ